MGEKGRPVYLCGQALTQYRRGQSDSGDSGWRRSTAPRRQRHPRPRLEAPAARNPHGVRPGWVSGGSRGDHLDTGPGHPRHIYDYRVFLKRDDSTKHIVTEATVDRVCCGWLVGVGVSRAAGVLFATKQRGV